MAEEKARKLRGYYHSLLGLQRLFESELKQHPYCEGSPVATLAGEIDRIEKGFPGLLPQFYLGSYFSHSSGNESFYKVSGILSFLASAVAHLEASLDTPIGTPVTQTREFTFVIDLELRKVIERDYAEIQRGYIGECWKSVIILSGGAIEALLTDRLLRDPERARAASKAPREPDIKKWDLAHVIDVSLQLQFVTSGVEKLSHSVREYRNLVHPGNEIRNNLKFGAEEAKIALEVLHIVWRDLSA